MSSPHQPERVQRLGGGASLLHRSSPRHPALPSAPLSPNAPDLPPGLLLTTDVSLFPSCPPVNFKAHAPECSPGEGLACPPCPDSVIALLAHGACPHTCPSEGVSIMPSAEKVPVNQDEMHRLHMPLPKTLAPRLSALPTAIDPRFHRW